ncbi:hypothetical protein PRZ48_010465 [Zasmidium cellare]|uniref:Uncharacterized protein n=1 Tax=Zasmidium cellare TaxID=395010 RepID=A0ABR0E9A1_ZASCE|nr:hypothetical protein PRZ48_010465 [Zasmidium cellare]
MRSFAVLRLFWFLILDTNASQEVTGARYVNTSSTSTTTLEPTTGLGDYIASGLELALASSSRTAAASDASTGFTPSSGLLDLSPQNGNNVTDRCWASWAGYWQTSARISSMFTTFTKQITAYDYTFSYSVWPVTKTQTKGNGNFPTATVETTLTTSSQVWRTISDSNSTTSMVITTRVSNTLATPSCALPSYVADCQSSWVAWGSSGAHNYLGRPPCTQASVPKSLCETVMSNWLASERGEAGEVGGKIGLDLTPITVNGTTSMSSSWPTSSTLAPGCTVGCQSCRVSGSSVKLLFWPPETTSRRNGTFIAATGKATGPVTARAYGTTLTSPTVYISFDKLHASNSCKVLGTPMSNIIVAITNSATLSSLYGWGRYWGMQETASFNFTDLYVTPVPHSIYMSQPRCASSSNSLLYSCLKFGTSAPAACSTENTPLLCATTLPYEPVISIPREVQQLQPEWDGCVGGIIGVYDPPSALQEAAVEDKPTLPAGGGSTTATTTQEAESAPDATTQASPSPTASTVPTATADLTTPKAEPTAESSSGRSAEVEASASPPKAPSASTPTSDPAPPTNNDPSQVAESSTETQLSDESTTQNALDVLSEAQTQTIEFQSTDGTPSPGQGFKPSASTDGNEASSPTASQPSIDSIDGSDSLVFTYDPSTAAEQNTAASSPATQNDPESLPTLPNDSESDPTTTIGDLPLFTFDPSSPSESAIQPHSTLAIITANSQTFSAIQSGSHIVIIDPTNTQILSPGQETILDSTQTLQLEPSQGLVVGGSTIPLNQPPQAAVWTARNGQTFSAIVQGSNIIIGGADTTATIPTAPTILAGQTLSVLPSNEGIVVDGSSVPISVAPTTSTGGAAILTASNGATISAHAAPDHGIVLADPSSTLTLSPGEGTTYQGQSYSVASSGGAVVVDGSSTVAVEETSLPVIATGSSPSNTTTRITTSTSSSHGDEAAASSASASTTASSTGSSAGRMPGGLLLLYILPLLYAYSLL